MKNRIITSGISGILLMSGLLLGSCQSDEKKADAYGNFEATEIVVSAKGTGELLMLRTEKGEELPADSLVGQIDTTNLYLQKMQLVSKRESLAAKTDEIDAQAEVLQVKKKYAKTALQRMENLFKEESATRQQLDNTSAEMEVIEKQLNQTRVNRKSIANELEVLDRQLDALNQQIADCSIINPIPGIVLEKYLEEKELAVAGRPVYSIADLNIMELKAFIGARQLTLIKTGDAVDVAIDGPDGLIHFPGTISWISSKAEFTPKVIQTSEDRVNLVYAIKVNVKNDGRIKIAMPGEVYFKTLAATK